MAEFDPARSATKSRSEVSRRFNDAGDASSEIYNGFNDWSAGTGALGINLGYASIAANWAVHGTQILSNPFSKWSVIVAILYLGLNLVCSAIMARKYRLRVDYSESNKQRWIDEFEKFGTQAHPWPYTHFIQELGGFMRALHVTGPLVSGLLLIGSMFAG